MSTNPTSFANPSGCVPQTYQVTIGGLAMEFSGKRVDLSGSYTLHYVGTRYDGRRCWRFDAPSGGWPTGISYLELTIVGERMYLTAGFPELTWEASGIDDPGSQREFKLQQTDGAPRGSGYTATATVVAQGPSLDLDRDAHLCDPRHQVTTYVFDKNAESFERIRADGRRATYRYDRGGKQVTMQDETGIYTSTYDDSGRKQAMITPCGATITYHYDSEGRCQFAVGSSGIPYTIVYASTFRRPSRVNGLDGEAFPAEDAAPLSALAQPPATSRTTMTYDRGVDSDSER
jgi:hypothetical protein